MEILAWLESNGRMMKFLADLKDSVMNVEEFEKNSLTHGRHRRQVVADSAKK